MPASSSSSANQARVALAERLRELRLDAGLTGQQLATRCGWSKPKTSHIENARTSPSDVDIRAWCQACGASEHIPDLIAAKRQADSAYMQWRRLQRAGLKRLQEASVPLYERTRLMRFYCPSVIPGVLQTGGYAHALLGTIATFDGSPEDITEAVNARLRRSHVMEEGEHRFALVLEETVLRYRIGDSEVMAGQLGRLLEVMSRPAVALGIVPSSADRENIMWPVEGFTIFDAELVRVELVSASVSVTAPSEIQQYERTFAKLTELAVYGAEARALILKAIEALH
ncbi:helix-turn-helix transcriptional regulator [Streptomyces malaysiensis subsp. malaysiensis]|uniref:helix-turn-helix domain-containing protein n=1 Tax=Streptomyces malaysiensis TaxID=92644 RepID=UPI0024C00E02|nr:helix-turn-helix transcriptional regulator [Streptomyces sp. NA07423]WHX19841.1 helix-turn-helix transcriptional regulator [Streptomyces sp. NA07423]